MSHIVHLDDPDSLKAAKLVVDTFKPGGARQPDLLAHNELNRLNRDDVSGVAVVAAVIGSGNMLQSISRDLRDSVQEKPRAYIVATAKQVEPRSQKLLRSDLAYNGNGLPHQVELLDELDLPGPESLGAWSKEEECLKRLYENLPEGLQEEIDGISAWLDQRLDILRRSEIDASNDLFLASPLGEPLVLRPGFAFWKFDYDNTSVTHCDVFATISWILQHLRTHKFESTQGPKLSTSSFHSDVIYPIVFGRYNDGIIQASILRSALQHELDYSADDELSGAMLRILKKILHRWTDKGRPVRNSYWHLLLIV